MWRLFVTWIVYGVRWVDGVKDVVFMGMGVCLWYVFMCVGCYLCGKERVKEKRREEGYVCKNIHTEEERKTGEGGCVFPIHARSLYLVCPHRRHTYRLHNT